MEGGGESDATIGEPYSSTSWAMIEHEDADTSESQFIPIVLNWHFGGPTTHYTSLQMHSDAITPIIPIW